MSRTVITSAAQTSIDTHRLTDVRPVTDADGVHVAYSASDAAGFGALTLDGRWVAKGYKTRGPVTSFVRKNLDALLPSAPLATVPVRCPNRACGGTLELTATPSHKCTRGHMTVTDRVWADGWTIDRDPARGTHALSYVWQAGAYAGRIADRAAEDSRTAAEDAERRERTAAERDAAPVPTVADAGCRVGAFVASNRDRGVSGLSVGNVPDTLRVDDLSSLASGRDVTSDVVERVTSWLAGFDHGADRGEVIAVAYEGRPELLRSDVVALLGAAADGAAADEREAGRILARVAGAANRVRVAAAAVASLGDRAPEGAAEDVQSCAESVARRMATVTALVAAREDDWQMYATGTTEAAEDVAREALAIAAECDAEAAARGVDGLPVEWVQTQKSGKGGVAEKWTVTVAGRWTFQAEHTRYGGFKAYAGADLVAHSASRDAFLEKLTEHVRPRAELHAAAAVAVRDGVSVKRGDHGSAYESAADAERRADMVKTLNGRMWERRDWTSKTPRPFGPAEFAVGDYVAWDCDGVSYVGQVWAHHVTRIPGYDVRDVSAVVVVSEDGVTVPGRAVPMTSHKPRGGERRTSVMGVKARSLAWNADRQLDLFADPSADAVADVTDAVRTGYGQRVRLVEDGACPGQHCPNGREWEGPRYSVEGRPARCAQCTAAHSSMPVSALPVPDAEDDADALTPEREAAEERPADADTTAPVNVAQAPVQRLPWDLRAPAPKFVHTVCERAAHAGWDVTRQSEYDGERITVKLQADTDAGRWSFELVWRITRGRYAASAADSLATWADGRTGPRGGYVRPTVGEVLDVIQGNPARSAGTSVPDAAPVRPDASAPVAVEYPEKAAEHALTPTHAHDRNQEKAAADVPLTPEHNPTEEEISSMTAQQDTTAPRTTAEALGLADGEAFHGYAGRFDGDYDITLASGERYVFRTPGFDRKTFSVRHMPDQDRETDTVSVAYVERYAEIMPAIRKHAAKNDPTGGRTPMGTLPSAWCDALNQVIRGGVYRSERGSWFADGVRGGNAHVRSQRAASAVLALGLVVLGDADDRGRRYARLSPLGVERLDKYKQEVPEEARQAAYAGAQPDAPEAVPVAAAVVHKTRTSEGSSEVADGDGTKWAWMANAWCSCGWTGTDTDRAIVRRMAKNHREDPERFPAAPKAAPVQGRTVTHPGADAVAARLRAEEEAPKAETPAPVADAAPVAVGGLYVGKPVTVGGRPGRIRSMDLDGTVRVAWDGDQGTAKVARTDLDGPTAEGDALRESAAEDRAKAHRSYEEHDTDGAVSQWGWGITSQRDDLAARIADAGGRWEFPALFDVAGNLLRAREFEGRFGWSWRIEGADGEVSWFRPSKARDEEKARANNAKKGFRIGRVLAPAKAVTVGSGKGLAGAMSVQVIVVRADDGYSTDVEIVHDGSAPVAPAAPAPVPVPAPASVAVPAPAPVVAPVEPVQGDDMTASKWRRSEAAGVVVRTVDYAGRSFEVERWKDAAGLRWHMAYADGVALAPVRGWGAAQESIRAHVAGSPAAAPAVAQAPVQPLPAPVVAPAPAEVPAAREPLALEAAAVAELEAEIRALPAGARLELPPAPVRALPRAERPALPRGGSGEADDYAARLLAEWAEEDAAAHEAWAWHWARDARQAAEDGRAAAEDAESLALQVTAYLALLDGDADAAGAQWLDTARVAGDAAAEAFAGNLSAV
ncbi:hypothetical protein ACIPRL_07945 [Streptomyces sp. NPDC090085]|uniref:hypothetical protein n=1 Tax=Streptomyces sp. NPDC090085 TaxID=3365943 RepID=UPI00381E626C